MRPAAPPSVGQLGELRLLRMLRRVFDRGAPEDRAVQVGNGDDALIWQPRGACVATVDSVTEGVDWLPGLTPPEAIGHRAAAVNLSDLAAMGAVPRHLLLALELPPEAPSDQVLRAAQGLAALATRWGCRISGGDIGFSPGPQRWSVTALGELQGPALRRDQARTGDHLWLVGEVGRASLGLAWLQHHRQVPPPGHWAEPFVAAHWRPEPQVARGLALHALLGQGVRLAGLDVSDGLVLDAARLCQASASGAVLQLPAPLWPPEALQWAVERGISPAECCGAGGDDYALLVAAPRDFALDAAPGLAGAQRVGEVVVGPVGRVFASVGGQVVAGAGGRHGN